MNNKRILAGATFGFILAYFILYNWQNPIGKIPLFILASIFIKITTIFYGPCPETYGDIICEERLAEAMPLVILFPFVCAFLGALFGAMVERIRK